MTNEDGYIGCYRIDRFDISYQATIENNTIDACKKKCVEYESPYAGASSDVCYCSDDNLKLSTLVKNEVVCDTPCPGKPTVKCGGGDFMSFYNATYTEKSTTASPSITQAITSSMTNDSNVTTDYINSTDVTSNSTTSQDQGYFDYDLMFPVLLVVGVLVMVIIGTIVAVLVRYHKRTKRQNAELDEDNDEHRGNVSPGEYNHFYAGGPGDNETEYDTTAARPVHQSHVEGHVYSRYNVHRGHVEDPDYSHIRGYQFGASAASQDEYSHIGDIRAGQLNVGADCYDRVDMSDRQGVKWSNKTYQPACDSGNDVYDHVQYNV